MKNISNPPDDGTMKKLLIGFAVAIAVITFSMALAHAEDRPGQARGVRGHPAVSRDWHEHEGHARRYWNGGGYDPGVIYAPPVVYSPPPVYQSPGLNLIIPLNIR